MQVHLGPARHVWSTRMGWWSLECQPYGPQTVGSPIICLWGLVGAYQWTCQSIYVCLPAPHILEAFNHKVNHDMHKELPTQEHVVMQYAWALQYVSFCNKRYKDKLAPAVWHFWEEVVKPFRSRALCNLDPFHLLGYSMHLNHGAKILDYGVQEHIDFICAPFFEGIESHSQYEQRKKRREESC